MNNNYETFGNYVLLEKLASGGMAEVYLAKKIAAGGVQKFVAVKRILQQFSDSEDFIQMFKAEAKIAINLSHSNVVAIYDFGTQDGQFYIVMEFVEGRNLRQVLNRMKKNNKYLSIAQVVHITKQVAAGLDHAHRCIDPTTGQPLNIIHRDMSPQNVMLSFEGEAKIVDFGIAKAETQIESTRAGTLKGKFGYMSPEQVEGQVIDSRTDIFALGIMIWEMLANQRLFLANSEINTLRKIRECDVPSLRKINPNIPSELDQIVQKALKKDKSQRYQTAAELSRDLQGFLSRFDPDFSVQDFGSFIKSLFSEEIIEIRKKQIVYSQVTVAASTANHDNERTEVVTQTHSTLIDDISFDEMSLNTITKSQQQENTGIIRQQKVAGLDFSNAGVDTKRKLQLVKREGSDHSKQLGQHTFTQSHTLTTARRKKKNGDTAVLTAIFAISFVLILFAYLNKFHPQFKANFCQSVPITGFCETTSTQVASSGEVLKIQSSPSGAAVYVNQQMVGKTPLEVKVKSLPFTLGLRRSGYKSHIEEIAAIPDSGAIGVNLKKVPSGWLIVRSVGAEIYVNGFKVASGQKVSVPANSDIHVKAISSINGKYTEEYVSVKPGAIHSMIITPPTGN